MLDKLIHVNQVGYVKGRCITENIRILSDIMFHTKQRKKAGKFINIDFTKAFDSVNWDFLVETLTKFNFGSSFIRWIKTFYTNISSCINNNGKLSETFKLGRGVRQGDPLSPYLFILMVEMLSIQIRDDKSIEGIKVGQHEIKLVQYADDMTGCISNVNSAKQFLQVVKVFGKYSGLTLNKSKTEGMWLGSERFSELEPLGIAWPKEPIRFLGVYLSYDKTQSDEINFSDKIKKCKQILALWGSRNLTFYGKTQVVKTFIISQFLYVTSAVYISDKYINDINKSNDYKFHMVRKLYQMVKEIHISRISYMEYKYYLFSICEQC